MVFFDNRVRFWSGRNCDSLSDNPGRRKPFFSISFLETTIPLWSVPRIGTRWASINHSGCSLCACSKTIVELGCMRTIKPEPWFSGPAISSRLEYRPFGHLTANHKRAGSLDEIAFLSEVDTTTNEQMIPANQSINLVIADHVVGFRATKECIKW